MFSPICYSVPSLPVSCIRIWKFAPLVLVFISAVAAVCAYLQALNYPFISDDTIYLTNNPKLLGLHLTELWRLFAEPYNAYSEFLPLRELSYWFDFALFGLTPSVFRLHNILLYLLSLPLAYGAALSLWRYFSPADTASAPWAAAAITALFALHPALAEPVVYISGRKDVLSSMFSLFALWLAISARREYGLSAPHAAAALVALLAAMLSKATAVAVAPVIALLWVIFWRDIQVSNRRRFLLLWPLASLLLATCIALIFATAITTRVPFYFGFEAVTRSLAVLGWLARLAISPESRHSFYPVFEDPYLSVMVAIGVAVLAAVAAGMVMLLRKRSLEGFALGVFLLLCIPSLQLVPYAPSSLVADRFLALAAWPVVLLLVALSWRLKPMPRIILLFAIALPWGFQTMERPRDLRSFEAMVDADLRAYPGYYLPAAYKIVGAQLPQGLYRDAMKTANSITFPVFRDIAVNFVEADYAVHVGAIASGKPQEAMNLLWKLGLAFKQLPVQAKWNTPMQGVWLYCHNRLVFECEHLAKHFPDDILVHYNAGLWMVDARKYKEAVAHLRVATESRRLPESVRGTAFQNLGLALLGSGQIAEAEFSLLTALKQPQPDMRVYCLLAMVYKQTGRLEEAARAETSCLNAPDKVTVR